MWWISRNGVLSGPFPRDQVEKRIKLGLIVSLDRVSEDKRNWTYIRDSEFWHQERTIPQPITMPPPGPIGKIGLASRFAPPAAVPPANPAPVSAPVATPVADMGYESEPSQAAPSTSPPSPNQTRQYAAQSGLGKPLIAALCVAGTAVVCLIAVLVVLLLRKNDGPNPAPPMDNPNAAPTAADSTERSSFSAVQDKLVIIECGDGCGSGFLAKMDGKVYLVSNEHVVRGEELPKATLLSGETLTLGAFSVATDRDLARFEVPGKTDGLEISETMPTMSDFCAIYGNSLGHGVATELKGKIVGVGPKFLETDAEFVPGNSGSPALDANGKIMGAADMTQNDKASDQDWGVKDTKFDAVRRFLVRLDNRVAWKSLDRREYEQQVARFNEFILFFDDYLFPYLAVDKLEKGKVSPYFKEQDQKSFGKDMFGFAECLVKVSKAYERRGRVAREYFSLEEEWAGKVEAARQDGARDVDIDRFTDNFWRQNDMKGRWEKVKDVNRAFIQQLQQALALGKTFLAENRWDAPQLVDGHAVDEVNNLGEGIAFWRRKIDWVKEDLDQRLRDLDKLIRQMEGRFDDEE